VVTVTHLTLNVVGTLRTKVDQQVALLEVGIVTATDLGSTGEAFATALEGRVKLQVGTVGPGVVVKVNVGSVRRNLAASQGPFGSVGVLAPLNLCQLTLDVTIAVSRGTRQLNIETDSKSATGLDATNVGTDFDLVGALILPRVGGVAGTRAVGGTFLAAVLGNTDGVRTTATSITIVPPVAILEAVVAAGARVAVAQRTGLTAAIRTVAGVNTIPAA